MAQLLRASDAGMWHVNPVHGAAGSAPRYAINTQIVLYIFRDLKSDDG